MITGKKFQRKYQLLHNCEERKKDPMMNLKNPITIKTNNGNRKRIIISGIIFVSLLIGLTVSTKKNQESINVSFLLLLNFIWFARCEICKYPHFFAFLNLFCKELQNCNGESKTQLRSSKNQPCALDLVPSSSPSASSRPTSNPTKSSSSTPSEIPSQKPSTKPSIEPTKSKFPSTTPSFTPSISSSSRPSSNPSVSFKPSSTFSPTIKGRYIPGFLQGKNHHGIYLSHGLKSRLIATTGIPVIYANDQLSRESFHENPDGAAVIVDPNNSGDYVYVSNSEVPNKKGGVGAIRFNKDGNVLDYRMVLKHTTDNCSGGVTPWNTWLSCEENKGTSGGGHIYEVDPFGNYPANKTLMGGEEGGNFETITVDNTNQSRPIFFISNDNKKGEVRRFVPDSEIVIAGNTSDILTNPGTMHYLVLDPKNLTFTWSENLRDGKTSAFQSFQNVEGIDYRHEHLYFVSKRQEEMFILDLVEMTYEVEPTGYGYFDGRPDQIIRYMNEPTKHELFFTEEGGRNGGVHARDKDGKYITILEGDGVSETAGLAFSPDNLRMYIAFYEEGQIFEITREDGLPFSAEPTPLRHHFVLDEL